MKVKGVGVVLELEIPIGGENKLVLGASQHKYRHGAVLVWKVLSQTVGCV